MLGIARGISRSRFSSCGSPKLLKFFYLLEGFLGFLRIPLGFLGVLRVSWGVFGFLGFPWGCLRFLKISKVPKGY